MNGKYDNSDVERLGISSGSIASMVLLGKVASVAIGGITFIIIARLLGSSGYGVYTLALGLSSLLISVSSISATQYFNKYIPQNVLKKKNDEVAEILGSGMLLLAIMGLAVSIAAVLLSGFIANYIFHSTSYVPIVLLTITSVLGSLLFGNLSAILISFGDGIHPALASVINYGLQAIISIALVIAGFGPIGAVAGFSAGLAVGAIYQIYYVLKFSSISLKMEGMRKRMKEMLFFSTPLTLSGIVGNATTNLSMLLISAFFGASVVGSIGSYGVATKIGNLIDIVVGSIGAVLIPMFTIANETNSIARKTNQIYRYSIYFSFLFTTPIIVYIIVFSTQIINTLFTDSFAAAPLYMIAIAISILIGLFSVSGGAIAMSRGEVLRVFKYSLAVDAAEIIALLVSARIFSTFSLIIALFFVNALATDAIYIWYVKKVLKLDIDYNISRIIAANVILGIVLLAFSMLGISPFVQLVIGIAITAIVYPIAVAFTKALNKGEIMVIIKIAENIPIIGSIMIGFLGYILRFIP